jgi:hypothetical protein
VLLVQVLERSGNLEANGKSRLNVRY